VIITIHIPDMEPVKVQILDTGDQFFRVVDILIHTNTGELLDRVHVSMNRNKLPHIVTSEFQEDIQQRAARYHRRPTD